MSSQESLKHSLLLAIACLTERGDSFSAEIFWWLHMSVEWNACMINAAVFVIDD